MLIATMYINVNVTSLNNSGTAELITCDVFNFVNIMQTNDPETIGNLAKFILHGLKLYT